MSHQHSEPFLDNSLLPVYAKYSADLSAGGALSLWQYLRQRADVDLAVAFSKLFWPDFVEDSGCVLLAQRYRSESFDAWKERLGEDLSGIEMVVNHVHVKDLFYTVPHLLDQPENIEFTTPLFGYLAQVLMTCWKYALLAAFPDKEFVFDYDVDPEGDGPVITFHQKRS